jgi:cytosine/uracil/thiamine/allantoin permease
VLPYVRYGMAYLLVRDAVGSVPCSDEWEFGIVTRPGSHGARGAMVPQLPREILALLWYYD